MSTWYTLYCLDCKASACEGTTYNLRDLSAAGKHAARLQLAFTMFGEDSPFEIRMGADWFGDDYCDDDDYDNRIVPFALRHFDHRLAIRDEYGHVHALDEPWEIIGEMAEE